MAPMPMTALMAGASDSQAGYSLTHSISAGRCCC